MAAPLERGRSLPDNLYQEPEPLTRSEALKTLQSGETGEVCYVLVCLALHDPDPSWLEATISPHLTSEDPAIRGVAATCMGHVARIHRRAPSQGTIQLLEALLEDPAAGGQAEDALGDIRFFAVSGKELQR